MSLAPSLTPVSDAEIFLALEQLVAEGSARRVRGEDGETLFEFASERFGFAVQA